LQGYGLQTGCNADLVLLQARDSVEAIRLRATRLKVWRRGQLLATTPKAAATLHIPGRSGEVNWQ
jgi:cytosine/creatinine deaminase